MCGLGHIVAVVEGNKRFVVFSIFRAMTCLLSSKAEGRGEELHAFKMHDAQGRNCRDIMG